YQPPRRMPSCPTTASAGLVSALCRSCFGAETGPEATARAGSDARRSAPVGQRLSALRACPGAYHSGANTLWEGCRYHLELPGLRGPRLRGDGPGRARALRIGGLVPAAETGARRRRRQAQLDRAAAVVGWQGRNDGRFLPGNRAVEGGPARQSAPEGHLPGGFGVRRLPRPLLLDGRRHEAGEPAGVDVREPQGG